MPLIFPYCPSASSGDEKLRRVIFAETILGGAQIAPESNLRLCTRFTTAVGAIAEI